MYPDLFNIPFTSVKLHSYGLMIMFGFVAAVWLVGKNAAKAATDKDTLIDMSILSMVVGILCAKVNYVLQYPENFKGAGAPFDLSDGNLSVVGVFILAPVPYLFYLWKTRAKRDPMGGPTFAFLAVMTVVCAVVGARGYYLATHAAEYDGKWKFLEDWRSGFVLYGGLVGGVAAGAAFVKWKKLSILSVGDICAPGMMLGVAIGRIGCFLQGCCWGGTTALPWAVKFPKVSSIYEFQQRMHLIEYDAPTSLAVHPTQIYEFLACLGITGALLFLLRRRTRQGEVLAQMGMMYAVWRFIVEMIRVDPRPQWSGLYYSQWVGIGVFAVCSLLLFYVKSQGVPVGPAPSNSAETSKPAGV